MMAIEGINYLAVLAAAVASFVFGAVWYGVLGKQWKAALGLSPEECKDKKMPVGLLVLTFVGQLVMAWVLAGVIGHMGEGQVTIMNGLHAAFFAWLGFVATSMIVNYAFQGRKRSLMAIDGAHWLIGLLIQGAIIGAMGIGAAAA